MQQQTFKSENTIWKVLIAIYTIAAVVYTFKMHDSIIRIDVLFMNPLLGLIPYILLTSRKLVIDDTTLRYTFMGNTLFDVEKKHVMCVDRGQGIIGRQQVIISYTDTECHAQKKVLHEPFKTEAINFINEWID